MSKLNIRPAGMTLERAMEIATAVASATPVRAAPERPSSQAELDRLRELFERDMSDPEIALAMGVRRGRVKYLRFASGLVRDGQIKVAKCARGHRFTPENTYIRPDGRRKCRVCARAAEDRRKARTMTTNQKVN